MKSFSFTLIGDYKLLNNFERKIDSIQHSEQEELITVLRRTC